MTLPGCRTQPVGVGARTLGERAEVSEALGPDGLFLLDCSEDVHCWRTVIAARINDYGRSCQILLGVK